MTISATSESKLKKIIKKTAAILFWVAAWYALFRAVNLDFLVASPVQVFKRLLELGATTEFWLTAGLSLARILLGFIAGVVAGTLLALMTTQSTFLADLFSPVITVIKTTPVASFILLALVWIKRDGVPEFISFLMVLPIIWANVSQGITNADKDLLEVAELYGFSRIKKLKHIYIPSVMPYFFAGCTTAMGLAWKAGVAAEVLSQPSVSIGTNLYSAKIYLETVDLFTWTAVVIILSVIIEKILKVILKKIRG